jgi:hypothetical protein
VFGDLDQYPSILSSINVSICKNKTERLNFVGPVSFNDNTIRHVNEVILPIADEVALSLGQPLESFEISVTNVGAASGNDLGIQISGYSADLAVFIALLSAYMRIPVSNETAFTGHIASRSGDIRMVKALPAKMKTASENTHIEKMVFPDTGMDKSISDLMPSNKKRVSDALISVKGKLICIPIQDISESLPHAFEDYQIVISSLNNGFFDIHFIENGHPSAIEKTILFLGGQNKERYWTILKKTFQLSDGASVKILINTIIQYYISLEKYPINIGERIYSIVCAVPLQILRSKFEFPLLSVPNFSQISKYAKESDYDDLKNLFTALVAGRVSGNNENKTINIENTKNDLDEHTNLNSIMAKISVERLTESIGVPIDSARASFPIQSITVRDHGEFNDIIESFFVHLHLYTNRVSDYKHVSTASPEANALVQRAFENKGGYDAALLECRNPINGGIRYVLDLMTEQYKYEEKEKFVNFVLKSALDPLNWELKVGLTKEILQRLENILPDEILNEPPEKFASHYEILVKSYVKSIDTFTQVIRSL